ncbi:protein FAR1-RELATED SEQUENCE 5-like [Bidens hawaiensis]|uniref:protein FAR1-RELATED SEQUENCE 5-like n=1 Tax=Bidens hawaiensis TaxID=980011 RepID=UPI004049CC86
MEIGSKQHVGQSSSVWSDDYDATTLAPEEVTVVTEKYPAVSENTSKDVLDLQAIVTVTNEPIFGQSTVQQGMNHEVLNAEEVQHVHPNYCYTPYGTKQWIPDVPTDEKPYVGLRFNTWDDVVNMYKAYAAKAGFDVRISTTTRTKGVISHKYIVCSKAGSPRCKDVDTLETPSSSSKRRNINIKVTGCNACIRLKVPSSSVGFEIYNFSEAQNHGLVDDFNMDLTRRRRQLQFSEKEFIHCLQTTGFGPTVAHRVLSSLKGGQHLVAGSKTDFKNHACNVRGVIADADAQMIVDRFNHNMSNLEDFFFQYKAVDGVLSSIFWFDGISRCNYSMFGEVLAFDATYIPTGNDCRILHNMIFVPFTGVDCHKKCVTFGAGLIYNETIESYKWLLNTFVSSHGKQSRLVLTDQDATMKQAVSTVLTESTHRLCMWHVTNKIHVKLKGEMQVNEQIRCRVNKLVWNVFIKPETFESRWHELIDDFNLSENKWLKDMFAIRDSWVPAYFRDLPMCCLMKTTSRCESSNSQFKVYSSHGNNLVQFMNCFEMALNAQRHVQRELQNDTTTKRPPIETRLPIERHASYVYTITIFKEVQKEITKGLYHCACSRLETKDGLNIHYINHKDKRNGFVGEFKVCHHPIDDTFSCSCKGFTRIGYLCRHILKVFQIELIDEIPENYIPKRWRSDVLPSSLFKIESRYGVLVDERSKLRHQFLSLANHCANRARGNIDLLQSLVDQMQQMKNNIWEKIPTEPSYNSKSAIIEDLVGYKIPDKVTITPPIRIRNKGSSSRKRKIGPGEKAKKRSKKPKRFCKKCNKHVHGHDSRNHEKIMLLKEQKRKEREQRRKIMDQKRKERVAVMEKQGREYVESDESVDTSETDSPSDSDDSSDTQSSSDE